MAKIQHSSNKNDNHCPLQLSTTAVILIKCCVHRDHQRVAKEQHEYGFDRFSGKLDNKVTEICESSSERNNNNDTPNIRTTITAYLTACEEETASSAASYWTLGAEDSTLTDASSTVVPEIRHWYYHLRVISHCNWWGLISSKSCVYNENIRAAFATFYWRILGWASMPRLSVPMMYEICIMIFTILIVLSITILPFCNFILLTQT